MANIKNNKNKWLILAFLVLLASLSFVVAGTKTEITVDFLTGSNKGNFEELGFYKVYNGDVVLTPIVEATELRLVYGKKAYVVDGQFSTDKMYVRGNVGGNVNYLYTIPKHNYDGEDHFHTDGVYFWFENSVCPTCTCNFNDFGFELIKIRTFYAYPQCSDDIDNDWDGYRDEKDPGCWDDPSNKYTYNPTLDNEADYDITCKSNYDCGGEELIEKNCQGDDIYDVISLNECVMPNTGLSYCSQSTNLEYFKTCDYGCMDGACKVRQDDEGPEIDLFKPKDNSFFSGTILFEYIPTDISKIEECSLIIDNNIVKSSTNINQNAENSFTKSTFNEGYHTAIVGCYDVYNNYGESNLVNFFYGDFEPECSVDSDCGRPTTNYFCEGDSVKKEIVTPTCLGHKCEEEITTEHVKDCSKGCLNGRCKSGKSSNDDVCEGNSCDPIIIQTTLDASGLSDDSIEIVYTNDTAVKTSEDKEPTISLTYLIIILLILLAIIVLALIIISRLRKNTPKRKLESKEYMY